MRVSCGELKDNSKRGASSLESTLMNGNFWWGVVVELAGSWIPDQGLNPMPPAEL